MLVVRPYKTMLKEVHPYRRVTSFADMPEANTESASQNVFLLQSPFVVLARDRHSVSIRKNPEFRGGA
jgi:hypothetical protein